MDNGIGGVKAENNIAHEQNLSCTLLECQCIVIFSSKSLKSKQWQGKLPTASSVSRDVTRLGRPFQDTWDTLQCR